MLDIKTCRSREKFKCIFVTKDNVDEFIEKCLVWYTRDGKKLKRKIDKCDNCINVIYDPKEDGGYAIKQIIFLNKWYVNLGYNGYELATNFEEDYLIEPENILPTTEMMYPDRISYIKGMEEYLQQLKQENDKSLISLENIL